MADRWNYWYKLFCSICFDSLRSEFVYDDSVFVFPFDKLHNTNTLPGQHYEREILSKAKFSAVVNLDRWRLLSNFIWILITNIVVSRFKMSESLNVICSKGKYVFPLSHIELVKIFNITISFSYYKTLKTVPTFLFLLNTIKHLRIYYIWNC